MQVFGKKYLVKKNQNANDIIEEILKAEKISRIDCFMIAPLFRGKNHFETGRKIFSFLKQKISYEKEPPEHQTSRTVARIIHDKKGDCKHYTIFAGAILSALQIPFVFRFVSFNFFDNAPTHTYILIDRKYVLDAVLHRYNKECAYKSKFDVSPLKN